MPIINFLKSFTKVLHSILIKIFKIPTLTNKRSIEKYIVCLKNNIILTSLLQVMMYQQKELS